MDENEFGMIAKIRPEHTTCIIVTLGKHRRFCLVIRCWEGVEERL